MAVSTREQPLARARSHRREAARRDRALLGGSTDGNELLTTVTGIVLLVMLAALGITILRIGQLVWEHLFIGMLLIGPVLLKLASTGYRFSRYYSGDASYVGKGPPWTPLRLLAPLVVLTTVVVFATGIVLLWLGPASREPWLLLHKASFILWLGCFGLHVLGHIPEVGRLLGVRAKIVSLPGIRTDLERFEQEGAHPGQPTPPTAAAEARAAGAAGRALVLGGAVIAGVVLALVLVPDFHSWTHWMTSFHGDH
jgi:hypothetical protein